MKRKRKYSSFRETVDHITRVREIMSSMLPELQSRALGHDQSKLHAPEKEVFDRVTPMLRGTTYGSPAYKRALKSMGVGLRHHYANNSHHPEHFTRGVNDMTLIDVMEMFCDWLAATERHADGDIFRSIRLNTKRFRLSPQLVMILRNTAAWHRGRLEQ
jgi:hypothetical protein